MAVVLAVASQLPAHTAAPAAPTKSYCHPVLQFCFKYPAAWSLLGSVFDGHGAAVAPPQKQEEAAWDVVTVAMVVPPPDEGADAVSIDEAIAQAVSGVRKSGQAFQTLQRQQRTVNGRPAQMVKFRYPEEGSGREWIEELVFIAGPHSEIYSLALKSSVASTARMEPYFQRIVASWHLQEAGSPTEELAAPAKPAQPPAAKPKTTAPTTPPKS